MLGVRPSDPLSHSLATAACGGFAAAGPAAGDVDRLLHGASAAGAAAFRSISTSARRSALSSECDQRLVYSDEVNSEHRLLFKW